MKGEGTDPPYNELLVNLTLAITLRCDRLFRSCCARCITLSHAFRRTKSFKLGCFSGRCVHNCVYMYMYIYIYVYLRASCLDLFCCPASLLRLLASSRATSSTTYSHARPPARPHAHPHAGRHARTHTCARAHMHTHPHPHTHPPTHRAFSYLRCFRGITPVAGIALHSTLHDISGSRLFFRENDVRTQTSSIAILLH